MSDNVGTMILVATEDKLPILDSLNDPVGLSTNSPIWVNADGVKFYVCNGSVTEEYLTFITESAATNNWTLLEFGDSLPNSAVVGWHYSAYGSDKQSTDYLYSWGLSPQQPTDL